MTSLASSPSSARPRWIVPLLITLLIGSALASWLMIRGGQEASVPAVVAAPETTALRVSVGNDPAALRVPKAKRASSPSAGASTASTVTPSSGAAPSAGTAAAPVARAPSSSSSAPSSSSGSAPEPAALEFGR